MARTDSLNNFLTDIANSIRNKKGTTDTIPASNFDTEIESIETEPNLQNKSITITENGTQTISPDIDYDGLNSVEVTTNVPSGGDTPTKGFVVNEWNSDGFPKKVTIKGITTIPKYYMGSDYYNGITEEKMGHMRYIEEIVVEDSTKLGNYCFGYLKQLKKITLPDTLTNADGYPFYSDSNLTKINIPEQMTKIPAYFFGTTLGTNLIKTLPDNITSIGNMGFATNKGLIQISMNNVSVFGASNYPVFNNCTNLKAIWIGSSATSNGLFNTTLQGCTSLQKIFINLPRATVESFSGYSYGFQNTNSDESRAKIICNDDEGFMTKEEFDTIDWNTYTG